MQEIAGSAFTLKAELVLWPWGLWAAPARADRAIRCRDRPCVVRANDRLPHLGPQILAAGDCGAASRWSYGRSAKAGRPRAIDEFPRREPVAAVTAAAHHRSKA
jgi:hypothetical protein